jgi:hypothetical protein
MTARLIKRPGTLDEDRLMENITYPVVMSEYDRVWTKYCGFLDLDMPSFMSVQESLLFQQLEKASRSPLGRKLIGERIPSSVEEYRRQVRLTEYKDYLPELECGDDAVLPQKPHVWASTSGEGGNCRRVPLTLEAYNRALDNLMAIFILACSRQRGHSTLARGDRVLYNVAPPPYLSGILAEGASRVSGLRSVMPPGTHDGIDFREKITRGFDMSLRTGVDIIMAMTSVLVKTGNDFKQMSNKSNLSRHLAHPGELVRVSRAFLRSRLENRAMLPRDLWPVKALIGWGIDTSVYRDLVHEHWGAYPYEFHASTEAGIMAVQSWTRRGMTFIPHSNFYEFIPESERLKSRRDICYEPYTLLLHELRTGERYELVITSFYGMPFIRYRLGHLVRIIALEDAEAGISLPQMVFEGRADDLIDIAGFTRVSEKTVTQALAGAGIEAEGWTIRKEIKEGKPALHLYIELHNGAAGADLALLLHTELMKADPGYHDLAAMMEIRPLQITALRPGTFQSYYRDMEQRGRQLALRRPPRMNASDDIIAGLMSPGEKRGVSVTR